MLWPALNGRLVIRVLFTETSAEATAVPPLPVLSVLLPGTGSGCVAATVAELSNEPAATIVAGTGIDALAPLVSEPMLQGSGSEQPPPVTFVIERFDGVSATVTFVAVDGPWFVT